MKNGIKLCISLVMGLLFGMSSELFCGHLQGQNNKKLIEAAQHNDEEAVREILGSYFDSINTPNPYSGDENGNTALMWAVRNNNIDMVEALLKVWILRAGIDMQNNDGDTPLKVARKYGNDGIAQLLLDAGAIDR